MWAGKRRGQQRDCLGEQPARGAVVIVSSEAAERSEALW